MRAHRLQNLECGETLDALIVGGGITGGPLYHRLCSAGYRTALIDKGDFSSGTSQASGMLIWGGLLYLKQFDLLTVRKLCKARNGLLRQFASEISPLDFRYPATGREGFGPRMMLMGLYLYWLLGGCALERPTLRRRAGAAGAPPLLQYQEGMLRESDSRFVIDRIRAFDSEHCLPVNYCGLVAAEFERQERCWRVVLCDQRTGREFTTKARHVFNCGGVWTDAINGLLGVESPYRHVFSKGVYLAIPPCGEEERRSATIYPMPGEADVLTHVPWGPVMMWEPTETAVHDLEPALSPNRGDLRFLLSSASRCLSRRVGAEEGQSALAILPGSSSSRCRRCALRPPASG